MKLISHSGPGNQLSTVIVSGVNYSNTITFPAQSPAGTTIALPSFRIRNDSVALETLEAYNLSFTASSVSGIVFGQPAQIEIEDKDGTLYIQIILFKSSLQKSEQLSTYIFHNCSFLALNVTFGKSQYSFTEKDGTVNIQVQISTAVAQNFSVEIKKSKAAINCTT